MNYSFLRPIKKPCDQCNNLRFWGKKRATRKRFCPPKPLFWDFCLAKLKQKSFYYQRVVSIGIYPSKSFAFLF